MTNDSKNLILPRRKFGSNFQIIAFYPDGDKVLCQRSSYAEIYDTFRDLVDFRLRSYMTFRSIKLVHPATHRVLCEYRDFRYIEKQDFEKLMNYGN